MTQILQPGNVPALSSDDPANQIADVFAEETWPLLWPGLLRSYANTAARDAELAGLGSSDRAFAFVEDSRTFWRWTGSAWALAAPWSQSGTFSVGAIAANSTGITQTVTFANPFPSANYDVRYDLAASRLSGGVSTSPARTASGFLAAISNFTSSATPAVTVRWTATLVP